MHTLLLADDSITTQRVVALTFADEAFRVVTVSDGQQALDAMAAMRPDIVLAGTTLARTNGYELSERMRGSEALRDIPVLLLSGAFETVDAAKLATCGARGVIEKPLEPTAVISRVRELLGLKNAGPAMPAGRLVTAPDAAAAARKPARPPQVSSWDELRQETGLEPDARPVDGGGNGSGREDYLDTLDAAFDSLDQHLAGRHLDSQAPSRNPSPPLGQASGAADPRSPGRRPARTTDGQASNSVFEVDTDWFSDEDKERDQAVGRDLVADTHVALPPRPEAGPAHAIFEVDDEWFAEDEKAREVRVAQQRELAAEMGIHDVELPGAEAVPEAPVPAEGLDFDFSLGDLAAAPAAPVVLDPAPAPVPAVTARAPIAVAPPVRPAAPLAPAAPPSPSPVVAAAVAPVAPGSVADDFAALLAFETGDGPALPPAAPVVVQVAAPEVTEEMLDQIAQRVVERLNAASFGADLREAMAASVRETVRSLVSETSERLVRDEIARVRARAERDTQ